MKVCIVRNAEVESNAGMLRIIDALLEKKYNLSIISRTRSENSAKHYFQKKTFKHKNVEYTNYEVQLKSEMGKGISNIFQLMIYQFFLLKILIKTRKQYDVIHSFDLDSGLVSLICSHIFNKKLVYHIADFYVDSRGGIPYFLKKVIRKIEYYVIAKANSVIICTEQRREQIAGSKPKKLYIVHNVPLINQTSKVHEITQSEKSENEKKFKVGYVGGLSKIHFTKEIIETISCNNNILLNIAGYGEFSSVVEEYSEKYDNIKYHGRIDYNTALSLYDKCDLMLMMYDPSVPNHKFSAPNKLYEAMALGKALIVAKGTGIDDIVEKENMGIAIDYSKEDFEEAILFLLNNPSVLKQMKNNAQNLYEKYSWKKMKNRIQDIYNAI